MQKLWRPTGSLTTRMRGLVALTVGVVVLVSAVLSGGWLFVERSHLLAVQARAVAVQYRAAAATAAAFSDRTAARAVVDLVGPAAGAMDASITGADGKTLARYTSPSASTGLPARLLPAVTVSLSLDDATSGALQVGVSRQPALMAMLGLLAMQVVALLAALGLATVVTARLRNAIVRPIRGLLDTMEGVGRHQDYGRRAQPDGPDEIGSLIISFNQMLGQIQERDEHLAEHRRQLQELVAERTRNLEVAAVEAEKSSRAKGDFLARMSHEIRTPMNGVVGMAELLQNTSLDARQLHMLQTMRRSADALLEIINDILDFSKIEAGRLQVVNDDFALIELVEDVCDLLASRAQERGLELVCHVDGSVPGQCNGDPLRLRQVIINLLGNAIKYTEKGHVVVRARAVDSSEGGFRLRIEVEDTGLGIPESELDSVFDAFTQVDTFETRKHGGTGLGLAITRQLVGLLGGEVGVSSQVGRGSTFWFELPLARPVHAAEPAPWTVPPLKVLLVQDHAASAGATRELLEAAGATVDVVSTGARAMEHLALDGDFGLAIVDQQLPDRSGAELLEQLRSSGLAAVPVVMLTPVAAPTGGAPDGSACEPDEWLVKPVRRARLAEAVNRALGIAEPAAQQSGDTSGPMPRSLGLKVLLVEDSPVNQEVACGMLEALGCDVVLAADGTLGVEHALGGHFDVVLMDCQMPLMDGYEASRRIRSGEASAERPAVPIVAITANALPGDRERCLAAGMTDFISKPFTLRKLQAVMRAVTGVSGTAGGASAAPVPAEQTAAPLPVIEVGQIEELRSLGRPQIVRQAILLFLKQAAQKLDEVDAALHAAVASDVEQAAHALKSSSLSVGGRRFAAAAGDCEVAARGGDMDGAATAARRLRPEFRELCKALSSLAQAEDHAA